MNLASITFDWNEEKNEYLKITRKICFEDVILAINEGMLLDVIKNVSSNHQGQYCLIVRINNYAYVVPFVKSGESIFLKTIFPDRKHNKTYMNKL